MDQPFIYLFQKAEYNAVHNRYE